jgi:hypothetical protein
MQCFRVNEEERENPNSAIRKLLMMQIKLGERARKLSVRDLDEWTEGSTVEAKQEKPDEEREPSHATDPGSPTFLMDHQSRLCA